MAVPHGHLEIVRGKADAPLGRVEPDLGLHRAGQEGVVGGLRRPCALVEAPEHHQVDALQPRFQRAPDMNARMAAMAGPDGEGAGQRAHRLGPLRERKGDPHIARQKPRQQAFERPAALAGIERVVPAPVVAADGFERGNGGANGLGEAVIGIVVEP